MGFFSWKTADTEESIANVHTGRAKPVYLIQPNGEPPISEAAYAGYGMFGGVDAYSWLADKNFGDPKLVDLAIMAECGRYHSDENNIYLCRMKISEEAFRRAVTTDKPVVMFTNFMSEMPNGLTPSELIGSGAWQENRLSLKFPLKFSFNPEARYEDLPASKLCPHQGFPPLPTK